MVQENTFSKGIRSVFLLDLRALALLRICLSLIIMTDIIFRLSDLEAFYTGQGILPLQALFQFHWDPAYFSLFATNDNYYLQGFLFGSYFFCAACLLVGYRTKLFTVLVWLFLVSLHNRNPLIMQAGDHLLRMVVFWAIFLPWGYLLSVDSLRNSGEKKSNAYESFASLAYICQIAFLYYFSALLKSSAEWRSEFTALYYALSIDQIIRPVGELLYPYYEFLRLLTAGTFYLELVLPLLLFMPFYNAWFRMAIIIGIALLQFGIFLTMNVGLFTATAVVIMIGILPTSFLDWAWSRFSTKIQSLKVLANRLMQRVPSLKEEGMAIAPPRPRLSSEILVTLALVYVLGWNMQTVGKKAIPDNLLWIGSLFKLHQHWGMFSPVVFKNDGWFIYAGTTKDGREIDLNRSGNPIDYQKPERVADLVKNDRWRKYGELIIMRDNAHFRPYLCNYLLEDWNSSHPGEPVTHLKVIYMHELSLPDYQTAEIEPWNLCDCTVVPQDGE